MNQPRIRYFQLNGIELLTTADNVDSGYIYIPDGERYEVTEGDEIVELISKTEVVTQLVEALEELHLWATQERTWWNEMHGSVTGDYENQFVNTANADNAQKIALAARVTGLSAILAATR